ncbi:acetyltransferase [Gottfriedia acidiceleris]|uniref:acetyltransferase n=1 Tax=Bacillaceae TaxID=186817 RepID=UPI000BEC2107|nr:MULTISPECIES: acetyltransferase [unclassified Bacillus (in: firmicutes)]PEC50517.1 acetyltransferase [Bacillus sp. AFS096315]PFM81950.1 acetyltransferase [Bacillus sp. AFS077874]
MKIIIVGNGGHSKVIQEMAYSLNHEIIAILDDKYTIEVRDNDVVFGPVNAIKKYLYDQVKVIIAIGNNELRNKIVNLLNINRDQYLSIIHPTAIVSPSAIIGNGTVVMPRTVINAGAKIGDHCIINTSSVVEHDNTIGDYSHISPNATLTGNVEIDVGVHIGAAATIIPSIKIGKWSVIGAGSTVLKNIPACSCAVGSPAKVIKTLDVGIEN